MADRTLLARQCSALGNENRLHIVAALRKQHAMTVGEAAKLLAVTVAAASRHLRILEAAGILRSRRRGLFRAYRLALAAPPWVKALLREVG